MIDKARIEALTTELDGLRRKLIELKGKDPDDKKRYCLYPPVESKAISLAEKKAGFEYAPSYRLFLQVHNGWLGFWPDWSLVGIPRKQNAEMHDDVKNTISLLPATTDKARREALVDEEKNDPREILVTNHPVLGTDFNGSLLVFDRNRVNKDGEPEVAWVHYGTVVERRWPELGSLLGDAIKDTRSKIEGFRPSKKN